MLDLGWSELLIIFVLALVVLGPKELPKAIKKISGIIKQVRGLAREFQSGLDDMVKDSEFEGARDAFRDVQNFNPRNQLKKLIDPADELEDDLDIDFTVDSPADVARKKAWQDSDAGKKALGIEDDGISENSSSYGAPDATDEFPVGEVPPKFQTASTAEALKGGAAPKPRRSTTRARKPEPSAEADMAKDPAAESVAKPVAKKAAAKKTTAKAKPKTKSQPKDETEA